MRARAWRGGVETTFTMRTVPAIANREQGENAVQVQVQYQKGYYEYIGEFVCDLLDCSFVFV